MKEGQKLVLAVSGWRNLTDRQLVFDTLDEFVVRHGKPTVVIHGGARGTDRLAEAWAKAHGVPVLAFVPDWQRHGKAAGVLRNTDIIASADYLVAFPSSRGRGTQDAIRKARARMSADRITVKEV